MKQIKINDNITISNNNKIAFIAGPCQLESLDHSRKICEFLKNLCDTLNIDLIFKGSFDKANRSSSKGKRGLGIEESMRIFEEIKKEFQCPVLTDVHKEEQCELVAKYVDILQIPAFLCRQTDLLHAALKHGNCVNVKKGQFLAPWDVKGIINKAESFVENPKLLLTERGNSFGYNNLVVDMRSLKIIGDTEYPVIIDATHAVQQPGYLSGLSSGGDRRFAPVIARAAVASCKIAAVFCEIHNDPDNAPSDGPNMLNFEMTEKLLKELKLIDEIIKAF
jgi:2-dehydro-3-deoxyphosphooctonate aldolase (KDO 8-P synthase)